MLAYFLWVTLSRSMTPIISRSTITKMAKGMKTYTPTVTGETVEYPEALHSFQLRGTFQGVNQIMVCVATMWATAYLFFQ